MRDLIEVSSYRHYGIKLTSTFCDNKNVLLELKESLLIMRDLWIGTLHQHHCTNSTGLSSKIFVRIFFSIMVFFTDTDDSQGNRGREGTIPVNFAKFSRTRTH